MASSVIGALRVNLGLDSAKFESGARRVQKPLQTMRKQFVAVSAVAVAMGAALSAAALKGAQEIDKSAKAARRLGTSIGSFRALELAAGEAGVSLSTLTDGVQTMDREIAKGSKGAARALDTLGLSAKDLGGLEADEKVALIADRIKELGLSTGQASVVLQDLGVRNREMVLAVLAGGDAFRNARKDIEDYGLAISSTDAAAIEQANDRIGRLGLIGQYAGQQLAIALVPALGAMAQAMTDSLREGGLLRTVIDGLTGNIERLGTYVAVAVTGFGVRYVGALVLARVATFNLAGALTFLKGALIRTGIGALIVLAGEMVFQFVRLVKGAGGFGNAMSAIGDLARAVFADMSANVAGFGQLANAVWHQMSADFILSIKSMADVLSDFTDMILNSPIEAILGVMGFDVELPKGRGLQAGLVAIAAEHDNAAVAAAKSAAGHFRSANKSGAAWEKFKGILASSADTVDSAADSATKLGGSLDALGDSAGGGAGKGGALEKIKKIKPALTELQQQFKNFKSSVASAFQGLITGAMSFKEALGSVLSSLASIIAERAVNSLFSGFTIPGLATGTPYAKGGLTMVGERGPELVNMPRGARVLNANQTRGALGGGGSITFAPQIDARGADAGAVKRLEAALARANAEFEGRVVRTVNIATTQRKIL